MSFSRDVKNFTTKTQGRSDKFVRLLVSKLAESLIQKTPVGDPSRWQTKYVPIGYVGGTARANWQYGNGSIPLSFLEQTDKTGERTLANVIKGVRATDPYAVHYITNNTPYIEALEDGHSSQAPHGMLKRTVLEFQQIFKAIKA